MPWFDRTSRGLLLWLAVLSLSSHALASRQDDSLMTVVDGASGPADRARALMRMAEEREHLRPGESLMQVHSALQFARQAGDETLRHDALVQMRSLQFKYGAQDEFMRVSIEAVELSERLGDPSRMASDLRWMAMAYERAGDMESAVITSRKALALATALNEPESTGRQMLELLRMLVKAGRTREAVAHGDDALRMFLQRNDTIGQASIWTLQAEAMLSGGKAVNALPLLVRAAKVLENAGPAAERMRLWAALGRTYHAMNDDVRAREHVDRAMELCEALGDRACMVELLDLSSHMHEAGGYLALALEEERRRQALEDSLIDRGIADRMAGMKELYRTGKLGRELEEMRSVVEANSSLIADARIRGRWWLMGFALLLVLLILCTWVLFSRRRAMHRIRLKNTVIRQQSERIHASNLELERQNRRLAEALLGEEEKGALLKEIHHRVKNNLQMVNALLRLQCDHLSDPAMNDLMRDAQSRVGTMALVHENIYRRGDLARIDLRSHLVELCGSVLASFGVNDRINVQVMSQIDMLPLDAMLPLSLLLNELLTNSIKHAYPGKGHGTIRVILNAREDGRCELFYHDDGIGLDPSLAFKGTFGMALMRAFVEQLEGTLRLVPGDGTTMIIAFSPLEQPLRKAG